MLGVPAQAAPALWCRAPGLFAEDLETDGDALDDPSAEDLLVDKEDLGGEDTHDDMKEWLDYLASLFRAEANLCRPSLPVRRV